MNEGWMDRGIFLPGWKEIGSRIRCLARIVTDNSPESLLREAPPPQPGFGYSL